MHTNSSLQAVTRLIEIGVEPFLVAPSLIGVMAQRLVRKICDNCKEKYTVSKKELEEYFSIDTDYEKIHFYRGKDAIIATTPVLKEELLYTKPLLSMKVYVV